MLKYIKINNQDKQSPIPMKISINPIIIFYVNFLFFNIFSVIKVTPVLVQLVIIVPTVNGALAVITNKYYPVGNRRIMIPID